MALALFWDERAIARGRLVVRPQSALKLARQAGTGVAAQPSRVSLPASPLIFPGGLGRARQLRLNVDGLAAPSGELGIVGLELGALARINRLSVACLAGAAI